MSKISDAIKNSSGLVNDMSKMLIESKLNSLFYLKSREDEVRKGLHASAIIDSHTHFCFREQVLSLFFKRGKEENLPVGLLRIFKEGNVIHEKWQNMFQLAGIARGIEDRGYSKLFDLYMTPDAIIEINNKLYVVEIKSCNTFAFKHLKDTHPAGTKQLQLYMHFTCIPRGFVLAEDKNTQEFKPLPCEYDPEIAKPYVERLYKINEYRQRFIDEKKLPSKVCNSPMCKRAKECPMAGACFGTKRELLE